jgi:hypothetical protein
MHSEPETYEQISELSLDTMSPDPALDDGSYYRCRWLDLFATVAIWLAFWLVIFFTWSAVRMIGRLRRNRCVDCGYDLRAATMDRCSECGRDIAESRRLVRRQLWTLSILVMLCAILIPLPLVRDAVRKQAEFREWGQSGQWLDDVASGNSPISSMSPEDNSLAFLAEVKEIEGHTEMIAVRLSQTTVQQEYEYLAGFITDLVDWYPEEQYLPLLDAIAERRDERGAYMWAISSYGCYPFDITGDRLLQYLDVERSDTETRFALAGLMRSWHESGDRSHDDEVRKVLVNVLDHSEHGPTLSNAL